MCLEKIAPLHPKCDIITGFCGGNANRSYQVRSHAFIGVKIKHPRVFERQIGQCPILVGSPVIEWSLCNAGSRLCCNVYCAIVAKRVQNMDIVAP